MFNKFAKDTTVLSLGTLSSRILGLIRDILIARYFGTSSVLEAFIVSFRLPNIFRSIFAEGFSDSVATPVLSEHRNHKERIFKISNCLLSLFTVFLSIFTIAGIIFANYLVLIIAPGFKGTPTFALAVSFTRIIFIYLFLISLSSNLVSALYSLKHFFVPAINPIFLNISFIIGIIFFSRFFRNYILVVCVLIAGVLQLIFPLISLAREGFILKFNFFGALREKEIIRMFKLFIPRIISSIVYHLSVFVDTIFSSLAPIVGEGALASVYYANRLIQFPFALIALSISRTAIVDLSSYEHKGDMDSFKKLFVISLQNIIFFIIPVAVIFLLIPEKIISVVFFGGKFGIESLKMTSSALFFYAFGLFFFCGSKLVSISFYALKDTFLPAKSAGISLVINIILSAILMFPLKIGGVALGSSLASAFNFLFLYQHLAKKIGKIDWEDTGAQFLKVLLLSLTTGTIGRIFLNWISFNKYVNILTASILMLVVFFIGGYFLGLKQINYIKRWILRKK